MVQRHGRHIVFVIFILAQAFTTVIQRFDEAGASRQAREFDDVSLQTPMHTPVSLA